MAFIVILSLFGLHQPTLVSATTYEAVVVWDAYDMYYAHDCGDGYNNNCEVQMHVWFCGEHDWSPWTYKTVRPGNVDSSMSYTVTPREESCTFVEVQFIERDGLGGDAVSELGQFSYPVSEDDYELDNTEDNYGHYVIDVWIHTV